ncbi:hypothetical protein LSH36_905g00009 [Paralvinella palmiformis]|uniref:Uncharacterized protein n=1 Tax=Paralvinella palmiformis TaxID=53620 RepID=A0AAD9MT46_9ANNE|nr:hypothetical protein LSH36_905g00009 [Paralvinella palmiformis]
MKGRKGLILAYLTKSDTNTKTPEMRMTCMPSLILFLSVLIGYTEKKKPNLNLCYYNETGRKWSKCDPISGKQNATVKLLKMQPKFCPKEKTMTRNCIENLKWSKCNRKTGKQNAKMKLKRSQPKYCPKEKIMTTSCNKSRGRIQARVLKLFSFIDSSLSMSQETMNRQIMRNCHYNDTHLEWSKCDPVTGKKTVTVKLRKRQPKYCPEERSWKKTCKKSRDSCLKDY